MTPHAIYCLSPSGPLGELEATGEVHFYCCLTDAIQSAIAEGYATSELYTSPGPIPATDVPACAVCEWCSAMIKGPNP